jgi:hypothetical protein
MPAGPGNGPTEGSPPGAGRDRDSAGRARNARPRDNLGRPLPRAAAGEAVTPDGPALPPGRTLTAAQRLIDTGRPFHAHEVLEAAWKAGPPAERELWRGLAQLAVGLTHASRGNARGAAALLRRGAELIDPYPDRPHGVDAGQVAAAAIALATRIDATGLDELTPADLRLILYRPETAD